MTFVKRIKSTILLITTLLIFSLQINAQKSNPAYNKILADSLGADEYGMKMYVLVMLKTGPNVVSDKAISDSLFGGHMKNINRLADEGKLVVAGPLEKNDKGYEGIFILNVKTIAEAKALLDTDPAVHAKVLAADLFGWYGSAALPMYLPASKKVGKTNF